MATKEVQRSVEAQTIINVLKEHKGESLTLKEISDIAGMPLFTGNLASGRTAKLIVANGEKEVEVMATKKVKTYTYIGDQGNLNNNNNNNNRTVMSLN